MKSLYRQVHVSIWSDRKFRELSDDGKMLFLFLLTSPETTSVPGCIGAGKAALAEELEWEVERLSKAFGELEFRGMAAADWRARMVWLPNALKHIVPASWKNIAGWIRYIHILPECDLKDRALGAIWIYAQTRSDEARDVLREAFGEAYLERCAQGADAPSDAPSNGPPQATEDAPSKGASEGPSDAPCQAGLGKGIGLGIGDPPPTPSAGAEGVAELELKPAGSGSSTPEQLVAVWNEATGGRITDVTGKRRRRAQAALKRQPDLAWWRRCFERAAEVREGSGAGWLTLDWILGEGRQGGWNAERVLEGVFDFRLEQAQGPPRRRPGGTAPPEGSKRTLAEGESVSGCCPACGKYAVGTRRNGRLVLSDHACNPSAAMRAIAGVILESDLKAEGVQHAAG